MLIGDPSIFAIESKITQAYSRRNFMGLGSFLLHIGGMTYGVNAPDATMLACSFDEVQERIAERGLHTAPFATEPNAGNIANAFRDAVYDPEEEEEQFFGFSRLEFRELVNLNNLVWAPDGDEAFDDGSYVLQFDVKDRVRLIAFRSIAGAYHHDPATLRDVFLQADKYYSILKSWHDLFEFNWKQAAKLGASG